MARGGGDRSSCRLTSGPYLGEVSALSFIHLPPSFSSLPYLLAGTGSQLLVYDIERGGLLNSFQVFEGIRIHGISLLSPDLKDTPHSSEAEFLIALYGERRVKLFLLHADAGSSSNVADGAVVGLHLVASLPGFDHWVLDACFLKEDDFLAVGLSDNSVALWNLSNSNVVARVKSSEKCLLYSMRMWGDSIHTFLVASGTIFNEIIVWKLIPESLLASSTFSMEPCDRSISITEDKKTSAKIYVGAHLARLIGHEGSIFRIAWSSDGKKLMSASDDRSARVWVFSDQMRTCEVPVGVPGDHISTSLTLFGHNARVWDCYVSDSFVITAGEDCTCRAWGMDGKQFMVLKEHIGRGIWRCVYDSASSLLITAGFDSAIKVHQLTFFSTPETKVQNGILDDFKDQREFFTICAPKVTKELSMMDSKSEYVRCICFARENILYVATNNGYLYHAEISSFQDIKWTKLIQSSEKAPIICMDVMSLNSLEFSVGVEDIVALGDGKGNVTVIRLIYDGHALKVSLSFSWLAEKERQLLGIHWCDSLGCQYLFTSDPRGTLKLWKIRENLQFDSQETVANVKVPLVAVFTTGVGQRIMCIDSSIKEEVLVCGDKRGNIALFSLSEGLVKANHGEMVDMISPLNFFKGAHGISSVNSIQIIQSYFDHVEISTTGGDGCICYFKYHKNIQKLEFVGMKQVKVLSTIQRVFSNSDSADVATGRYAIGFTSVDFIIWDLTNDTQTVQVPCGGWRRPYSFYLGTVPQYQNCFAYLKDYAIHVHRLWLLAEEKLFPRTLHIQYHGREIHSMSFICLRLESEAKNSRHSWIVTGCEDGSVRLTRYSSFEMTKWSESKLLGEHVGGSAVRSICFVSKINKFRCQNCDSFGKYTYHHSANDVNDLSLLISVGSKRVLTSWVLRSSSPKDTEAHLSQSNKGSSELSVPLESQFSSLSFQWLSTYMPSKCSRNRQRVATLIESSGLEGSSRKSDLSSRSARESSFLDQNENDWRYMAVTAFLLKHADSRLTVCFIVVACSDATLVLRALLMPYRLWFDVALLVPTNSPVLSLQHIVVSRNSSTKDIAQTGDAYIIISGSTDGSITFWDLTDSVENFMRLVLDVPPQMLIDSKSRPQTGRGSQGGRWWKSSMSIPSQNNVKSLSRNDSSDESSIDNVSMASSMQVNGQTNYPSKTCSITSHTRQGLSENFPSESHEVQALHVLNSVHQSGVNCLHVSVLKEYQHSNSEIAYCVFSGGDDQSLHCLGFSLTFQPANTDSYYSQAAGKTVASGNEKKLRVLFRSKVASAHSSAVKGVWTDGLWAFSVGLDQRLRCWSIDSNGEIAEHGHLIVSVPEPEALSAILCDNSKNIYQIAVAGRGMQMVTFDASSAED